MTRREVAEKVFKYIRENKFEPVNIRYGNSYFIFDKGEDGVVYFSIKEIKMLDLWFRKDSYKNMYLILTRDGVEGRYGYTMADGDANKLIKNIIGKIKNKLNVLSKKGR